MIRLAERGAPVLPQLLVREAAGLLRRSGIGNAVEEARWLAVHAARVNGTPVAHPPAAGTRAWSLAHMLFDDEPVPWEIAERFRELVRRRAAHEPLQYLLGSAFFLGLEFAVTPATLIPRPETELLVEEAARRLGDAPCRALELGTGSGCVAIGLTRLRPACRMVAVEQSFEALQVARRNGRRHGVAERVAFVQGDWLDALRGTDVFDAIVSNPPYIPTDELTALPMDVQQEPRAALDGGPDGLRYHRRLLQEGARWLRPGGWLLMELGVGQAPRAAAHARAVGRWSRPTLVRDPQGIERIFITQRNRTGTGTGSGSLSSR